MERETATLVASFVDPRARTWSMWEAMIRSIPEAEWRQGDNDYLISAKHLIHAIAP